MHEDSEAGLRGGAPCTRPVYRDTGVAPHAVRNNNNNKRPLTPESMPNAEKKGLGNAHIKKE